MNAPPNKVTTARFAVRIVNMKDLGEWDDAPDDERARVFYDALYAIMYAEVHGSLELINQWLINNEALMYDTDDDKLVEA